MLTRPKGYLVAPLLLVVVGLLSLYAIAPEEPTPHSSPDQQSVAVVATVEARSGRSVDAAATTRTVAAMGSRNRLRVIDAADSGPLLDSQVQLLRAQQAAITLHSDASGMIVLPKPTDASTPTTMKFVASCPGYVALRGQLDATTAETVIALERAGTVRATITDTDGTPAAGVEVVLLPPLAQPNDWEREWNQLRGSKAKLVPDDVHVPTDTNGKRMQASEKLVHLSGTRTLAARLLTQSAWRQVSDEHGVVTWRGVSPAAGYRWGVFGNNHATLAPAYEHTRLRITEDGVQVSGIPIDNLSGRFDVHADAIANVDAQLHGQARVHGRIRCGRDAQLLVKLCRIRQAGGDGVQSVVTFDPEHVQSATQGKFDFTAVRPGLFAVRACWLEEERHVHFASVTLRLEPNADLDLGEIQPMQGAQVTVSASLDDAGRALSPSSVFVAGDRADAILTMAFLPDSQLASDSITEFARVPFGKHFVLHGVPAGRVQLMAQAAHDLVALPHIQRVEASETFETPVTSRNRHVQLRLPVQQGVRHVLHVTDESGTAVAISLLQVCERTTGRVETIEVSADGELPIQQTSAVFAPGIYDAWVSVGRGQHWLGAHFEVDATKDGNDVVTVALQRTAELHGKVVDVRGAAVGNYVVRWSPTPLAKAGVWLFSDRTDASGNFRIAGVMAGVPITGERQLPSYPGQYPGATNPKTIVLE